MLQKSPSGSLCPYHYKGAALQPLHYGSYHDDLAGLAGVVAAEEKFILASHGGRRVWIDLYETRLDNAACDLLAGHLARISRKLARLALVGCSWRARMRLDRQLRKQGCAVVPTYFMDPELAKDWLVGLPLQ